MHVLVVPSWYPRSSGDFHGSFFREQTEALARSGIQMGVMVPTPSPWYTHLTNLREIAAQIRLPIFQIEEDIPVLRASVPQPVPKLRFLNTFAARGTLDHAWDLYVDRYGKPDVLHAHSLYPGAFFAHYLAKKHHVPFVYTEHRSLSHMPVLSPFGRAVERSVARAAAQRIAVSHGHAEHLARRFGMQPAQWRYIPNLLPPAMSASRTKEDASNSDPKRFVVGHLSVLDPVKGVSNLIRAFSHAFSDDSSAILRIGGDGEERAALERLAAEVPGASRIEFLGRLDRDAVLDFYREIDTFVLPSTSEPMGIVLIEALAQGVPVIATRTWGGETIVEPGDGWLVPVDNVDALSEALHTARSTHFSAADRENLRIRTIDRFGEEAFVARYRQVYILAMSSTSEE